MGALELRNGAADAGDDQRFPWMSIKAMPLDLVFDYLGIRLYGLESNR